MPKITIKLDFEQDAWNWWEACNRVSHGVDWKSKIDGGLREKITGKSKEEAFSFLLPYLESFYYNLYYKIDDYIKEMQSGFDKYSDQLFAIMSKVTKREIYRNEFTCFITSFPRFSYDYDLGQIWLSYHLGLEDQLEIFIHELLHFQYFAYYGEKVWDALDAEKHERLKEVMTVIINDEFKEITSVNDEGYEIDRVLRQRLIEIWRKNKDMDLFINKAIELMR